MSLAKQFKTDDGLEKKGIVIDYGDARIRIARAGGANKAFSKSLDRRTKPFRRAIAAGSFDNEHSNDILKEVYAECVVLDWETNVGTDDAGEITWAQGIAPEDAGLPEGDLLPVNHANILKVFRHLPDLFQDLVSQAQSGALFRAEIDDAVAGN